MVRNVRLVPGASRRNFGEERHWLASQGFSTASLPKRATWYRPDGLAIPNLPTDAYHLALYRGKGWTLKPSPVGERPEHAQDSPQKSRTAQPGAKAVAEVPPGVIPQEKAKVRVPRLARGVLRVLDSRDSWQGTATELMALLDPYAPPGGRPWRTVGMPLNAARLAKEIMAPKVAAALVASGVTVTRGYRGHERVLRLSRR